MNTGTSHCCHIPTKLTPTSGAAYVLRAAAERRCHQLFLSQPFLWYCSKHDTKASLLPSHAQTMVTQLHLKVGGKEDAALHPAWLLPQPSGHTQGMSWMGTAHAVGSPLRALEVFLGSGCSSTQYKSNPKHKGSTEDGFSTEGSMGKAGQRKFLMLHLCPSSSLPG